MKNNNKNNSTDSSTDGWNRRKFLKTLPVAIGTPYFFLKRNTAEESISSSFTSKSPDPDITPDQLLETVPKPVIPLRPDLVEMYNKCWVLGLQNTGYNSPENNFVDWFIDEGFDSRIFQWDTSFSMTWAKYSQGGLPNIVSQDNFYRNQHENGAIGGAIRKNGKDNQPTDSPSFSHNNLFSWAEWDYYMITGDASRFERVVPILDKYADWVRKNRRHENGHYYWSGFGSGMDNSPRSKARSFYPPYNWIDYDANEALAAWYLVKMAEVAGFKDIAIKYRNFHSEMKKLINRDMWSPGDQFYWDTDKDGTFMKVKTIASFWPMWARITDQQHVDGLVNHLNDSDSFNRPHRVPTTAADEEKYVPSGGYWRGSIWAPTNHMVVKGLQANNRIKLARDITLNHLDNMAAVFQGTNTVWENYAPEFTKPGQPAKRDFVGWSADGPIAQLIENYIGINLDVPNNSINWNLLTTEKVGLKNIKFGDDGRIDLIASERKHLDDPVQIEINSTKSFKLILNNGRQIIEKQIPAGEQKISIG